MTIYLRRKLAGDCVRCGKKLAADAASVSCDACRAYSKTWKTSNPDLRRQHGRDWGRNNRDKTTEGRRRLTARRKAVGECVRCGAMKGTKFACCDACRAAGRAWKAAHRKPARMVAP